jgi:SAM-dependent methyltransferase
MGPLAKLAATLARHPGVLAFCRSLLENDFKALRTVIRDELQLGREVRTLDLGCGPGTFSDLFAAGDYVGADIDARCIDHARRTRPGTFIVTDARALDLPDARFDQALIHGLLRHLTEGDVGAVLRETRRVLVPGGRVLIIEDIAPVSRLNLAGRLLRRLGPAEQLRGSSDYQRLFQEAGRVARERTMRSGVWDYFAAVVQF